MGKIRDNIKRLREYFKLSCRVRRGEEVSIAQLLGSTAALKSFGEIGLEHKVDLLTIMAKIEYEYGRDHEYTKEQMTAVKYTLAQIYKAFTGCGYALEQFEVNQAKEKLNQPINQ